MSHSAPPRTSSRPGGVLRGPRRPPPARSEPHGTFSKFLDGSAEGACPGRVLGGGCERKKSWGVWRLHTNFALWRTLCLLAHRRPDPRGEHVQSMGHA
eukprot:6199422-Prymnesium_polylepis.1